MPDIQRRRVAAGVAAAIGTAATGRYVWGQSAGKPIRIGGTLGLTGPLAPQTTTHKLVADIYIEQLNKKGGLLGRPVEYILLDDQAKPDIARAHYDRLLNVDKVDLVVGAFGTAANLAAMSLAQRHGKVLVTNSVAVPKLATYAMHFPAQGVPFDPERSFVNTVLEGLRSIGKTPKTMAIVGSKFPSIQFISLGAREVAAEKGVKVPLYLEYEFGSRDFGPIAARIKDADPDFVWVGALGTEAVALAQALKRIDYTPKGHFYLFPAAGAMVAVQECNYSFSLSAFEQHPPFTQRPGIADFVSAFNERAPKAGLAYPKVEHQASIAYAMWQVLEAGVRGANSLDDKSIAQWLKSNQVQTILGTQRFDGPNNFGPDLHKLVQLQNGSWVAVYPSDVAAPGAKIVYPRPT